LCWGPRDENLVERLQASAQGAAGPAVIFSSGLPETACGAGSTLEATAYMRERLPALLRGLGVKRLLDAPCGDFNWMAHVDLGGIEYVGVDSNADHIKTAMTNANRSPVASSPLFVLADIVSGHLPEADAVLSRDFFQHLPLADCNRALSNFAATGARWLIATNFLNETNKDLPAPGGFRFLNLLQEPFELIEHRPAIEDPPGSGRWLAVFRL